MSSRQLDRRPWRALPSVNTRDAARRFEMALAALCALGAVACFATSHLVAGPLLGFVSVFFVVNVVTRPAQILRSMARERGMIVVGLPPGERIRSIGDVAVPATATLIGGATAGWMNWEGVFTLVILTSLWVLGVLVGTRERFLVSGEAVERVPGWGRRWSTRLPWGDVRRFAFTVRDTEGGGEVPGFYVEGRAPKRWCTYMFVPLHLDGIADFAEVALRNVPPEVLANDVASRGRLEALSTGHATDAAFP